MKSLQIKRAQSLASFVENKDLYDSVDELKNEKNLEHETLLVRDIIELNDSLTDMKNVLVKRAQSMANLVENKDLEESVNEIQSSEIDIKAENIITNEVDEKDLIENNTNLKIKRTRSLVNLLKNTDEENSHEVNELTQPDVPRAIKINQDTFTGEKLNENLVTVENKPQNMVKETEQVEIVEELTEFTETVETILVKSKASPVEDESLEDLKSQTSSKKAVNQVGPIEEVNNEENLSDLKTDQIEQVKPESKIEQTIQLEMPKLIMKQLSQVNQINENVKEENCDQIVKQTEKQEEKAQQSETKDSNEELSKPNDVKYSAKSLEVLKSNWKPFIKIFETENLDLNLTINRPPQSIETIVIYKNDVKLDTTKENIVTACRIDSKENSEISFNLKEAKKDQTGKYKLCIKEKGQTKEKELAASDLLVNEKPLTVISQLKSDKTDYIENDDVLLKFKLSKPLVDKEKCIQWQLDDEVIEILETTHYEMSEEITETEEVIYSLKIKSVKPKTDEGTYKLKVFSVPNDKKSEIYNGQINITVQEEPVKVLETNWTPKIDLNEEEKLELSVSINKRLDTTDRIVLTKNGIRMKSNETISITLNNDKLLPDSQDSACEIKLSLPQVLAKDSGLYKLSLKSENRRISDAELGQTNLTVKEVPLEVLSVLSPDKTEYFENEEITLSLKLSKAVEDIDRCLTWSLNGRVLDMNSSRIEILEEKLENGVFYTVKIKDAQISRNDGQYTVKIKSKIFDRKEITESCKVLIKERQIEYEILESNWNAEIETPENKAFELFLRLKVNHPLTESNILIYRDMFPIVPNEKIEFTTQNIENENQCLLKLKFNNAAKEESGVYKLCLKNKNREMLVSTNLFVGKRLKIVEGFRSDKESYFELEDIRFTIKLNEPVEDKKKCFNWFYNDKLIFIEDHNYEFVEEISEKCTTYSLKIKSAKIGVHDGSYKLAVISNPDDKKSQIYKNEVKIVINEVQLDVFDSNWSENIHLNENDSLELRFSLNKLINKDELVLYKDGRETITDIDIHQLSIQKYEENNTTQVTFKLNEVKSKQSGKYKVALKGRKNFRIIETDLVSSKIVIEEIPCTVLDQLKSEKIEYNEGENICIAFKLSKPVQDKDKCIQWMLNNKSIDFKSKQHKFTEEESTNGTSYKLNIESCQVGKNDGEYSVKVKSKTLDKSDLFNGSLKISVIDPNKFDILETNWIPEIKLKEDDNHELFVKISKPLSDIKDLKLTKDSKLVTVNSQVTLTYENVKLDEKKENCLIKVKFNEVKPSDSGSYKLTIADKKLKELDLGITDLIVTETPFVVLEQINLDKPSYYTGDDIVISIKLTKPLLDRQKCFILTQNGKTLNLKDFLFSEDIQQSLETVYNLKITSCNPNDHKGEYSLRLLSKPNDKATEFYTGKVSVFIENKPVDILSKLQLKETKEIYENEEFTLVCKLNTANLPIKWLRNDKPIDGIQTKSKKYLPISNPDGTYTLTVYTTTTEDSGTYSINLPAGSNLSTKSDSNDLKSNVSIKLPAISISKEIEVKPGDKLYTKETADLIIVLSRSTYSYEWFKNGIALKTDANSRYSLSTSVEKNEKFSIKLTIKELETEDSGDYKLIAEQVESKSVSLLVQSLNINLSLIEPNVDSSNSVIEIEEDTDLLKFECKTNKDFNGKVQWFKNEKTISLIDAALYKTEKIVEDSTFVYRLLASKPKTTRLVKTVDYNYHSGSYYAQFNSAIKSNRLEIKINRAPPNEFGEHLHYQVFNSKSNEAISEHSSLVLRCTTKMKIKSGTIVKWFKNKIELTETASYLSQKIQNNEFELSIPDCMAERDTGTYRIEIGENDSKLAEEIKIEILKEKMNLEALVIQGDDIHEGGQVVLVAKVNHKPKQVEWLKDGKPLSFKDKRFIPIIENDEIKLKIDNLQMSDNSVYSLKVDDSDSSYKLVVNELPIKFIKELAYEIVSSEDKSNSQDCLKLSCMTNKSLNLNDNKYSIKWFKDGSLVKSESLISSVQAKGSKIPTKIGSSKYQQSSEDEKKTHILHVNSLEKNDCGNYEVRVYEFESEKLLAQSSTNLRLNDLLKYLPEEPKLVGSLECSNDSPAEGQSVSITSKLSSPLDRKQYKLQWYINKEPIEQTRKFPRYFIENRKDIEPNLEIIDMKESEEGCEIELALIKLDNNNELSRFSIKLNQPEKLEKQIRSLKDLGILKIKEGETLNLKVKFDRHINEADVKVFFNDKEFIAREHGLSAETKYRPDNHEFSITILDAQTARDEGRYKIQSLNTKSDCQVLIEEKPIKFVTELENFKLKLLPAVIFEQGETDLNKDSFESHFSRSATFDCVLSKSFSEVSWFINEIQIDGTIKDFSRYKINCSEDGKIHSLTIKDCTLKDNDSTVQIKLAKANKKSSAQLKVDQMPFDYLIKMKRALDDCRVKEGETANFQCDISLSATLEPLNLEIIPEWFRKCDHLAQDSTKYETINEIEKNFRTFKLKIKNCVTSHDAGEYSCHFYINNKKTESVKNTCIIQSKANLIVKENETLLLSELEPSVTVAQGETIELECELSKPGLEVEWFKDGKPVNKDNAYVIKSFTKSEGHYCYKLTIQNADSKQNGRFKLLYKNISTECKVVVKEPKLDIKIPLKPDFTIKENSEALFETEYTQSIASDFFRIEWFKSGKRLYFSNKSLKYHMKLEESRMSLIIKDCTEEDDGNYEVKVYSGLEDKPLVQKTKLTVQPLEVVILEKLNDIVLNEGETAKMVFKASKSCSCQWYRVKEEQFIQMLEKNQVLINDKTKFELLSPDDRIVFSLKPDNVFGLSIHDVKLSENGIYMALLKTSMSESNTLIFTSAKVTVSQVHIEIKFKCPDTITVTESSKLSINCSLSKIPTENVISRIKAFKNDKLIPLSTDDNKTIYELVSVGSKTDPQLQFIIDNVKLEDAGKYSLKLDESKTSCQVKVLEKPSQGKKEEKILSSLDEMPRIVKDLKSEPIEYTTIEPFSIILIAEGEDLRVEWYHDDKKVIPLMNQVEFIKLDDAPHRYEFVFNFNNPFISDSGKYQCRISNKYGSIMSASANIKIKDPKESEKEVDDSLFQSKPRFIEYFSDVYMEQASEAQFKCKIIGKPEPKVIWYCNCRKITANEKFELIKDETDHYTLVVKNVNFNDEGEYTCKASNLKGETSWSANLYLNENQNKKASPVSVDEIKPAKALVAPNFLRKIKDSTVSEGHSAK